MRAERCLLAHADIMKTSRRSFVQRGVACAALAGLTDLGFLSRLGRVDAADAGLGGAQMVRLHSEIEPLVRLLEETPQERVIEEVAARVRKGLTYREVLAATFLAGARNIKPHPIG